MRGSILVIDDDAALRELFKTVLARAGYHVTTAGDGLEALDCLWQAGAAQPDAILLDLEMPRLDGRAFLRLYHEKPWPHAPVIVVSSAQLGGRLRPHVAAVLPKPCDLETLLATVAAAMAQSRTRPAA